MYSSDCCISYHSAYIEDVDDYVPPRFLFSDGIREASMRHDALAKKKYCKPFKSFKFNRARRQRP